MIMKKLLFTTLILVVTLSAYSQNREARLAPDRAKQLEVDLSDKHFLKAPVSTSAPGHLPSEGIRSASEFIEIGTAYNIFTILTEGQNQVSYNSDLNSLIFLHRHNDETPGGSGGLSFDMSTDGGSTWSTNTGLSPEYNAGDYPINAGNRYPNGAIYNPDGNTDPNEAYIVGVGPALDNESDGSTWGLRFRVSAKADGSNTSESYFQEEGISEYFAKGLSVKPDGSMWTLSTIINVNEPETEDSINSSIFTIDRGIFNAGTNSMDWEAYRTIEPDYHFYTDAVGDNYYTTFTYNMAFSVDGMTGYSIINGGPNGAEELAPKPMVWKTEDGGDTWNYLPDFNFSTIPDASWLLASNQGLGPVIPYFLTVDATVDQDGYLNLVSEVNSRFVSSSDPDSLYFIYGGENVTGIYHFRTSDGTDWSGALIDSIEVEDGTLDSPPSTISVNPNPQIGRNADGSKLFFSWCDSDPNLVTTNDLPDLIGAGYDVATGDYTFVQNFTKGTSYDGVAFFPTLAPDCIDGGDDFDYEMPIVFAVPGADALSPPQFVYAKGVGFDEEHFGAIAPMPVAGFTYVLDNRDASFMNTSTYADSYLWDFNDGSALNISVNPVHSYDANGTYNVCLTALNAAGSNESCQDVTVMGSGIEDQILDAAVTLFPTPTTGRVNLTINSNSFEVATITVYNIIGAQVMESVKQDLRLNNMFDLDLSDLSEGNYFVKIETENAFITRQVNVVR